MQLGLPRISVTATYGASAELEVYCVFTDRSWHPSALSGNSGLDKLDVPATQRQVFEKRLYEKQGSDSESVEYSVKTSTSRAYSDKIILRNKPHVFEAPNIVTLREIFRRLFGTRHNDHARATNMWQCRGSPEVTLGQSTSTRLA